MATFQDASHHFFALSLQADPTGDYPLADAYEVVVVVDTSATQTGPVRIESLEVLDELARSLPVSARVSLLACDVDCVDLSGGLTQPSDARWETAVARLQKRIPLGTTNLGKALRTAAQQFSDTVAQRTILYIGDGINRTHFLTGAEHRQLVDELVAARITVSSLAIGPMVDMATLAALANHTGGIVLARNEIDESTQAIGRHLGQSATLPVVWVTDAQLPPSLASHFPQRFPPLRVDRDSVVVGQFSAAASEADLLLRGVSGGAKAVEVALRVTPEASNPDMGFLAAVTEAAQRDGGLAMPALGSQGLRAMSYMFADNANAMVKAGQFALKSGEIESAIRIAQEALKQDPNNAEALSLLHAAQRVAGDAIPTGKFMQFGGDDPFAPTAGEPADDVAPVAPAGDSEPVVSDVAPAVGSQPPAAAAGLAPASLLDETLDAGQLLADEQALRRARAQAIDTEVRQRINQANEQLRRDPSMASSVTRDLKLLLERVDGLTDTDASARAQLRSLVSTALQNAAEKEARYLDQVQRAETIRAQADQAQRLLAETNRQDETLKQLVEQFNFLMKEQRYLEASKDVAPEIGRNAPDTVLDNITREESSLASNYALNREAFEAREQGFVDAMRGVEQAAVPFDGNPPLIYPPPEVWQALSARRKERYGAINLAGGNSSEQRIYTALKQETSPDYNATPLRQVMTGLADDLNIPIWINQPELDLLGVDPDSPITLTLPPVSLRSALRLMLEPLEMTYIIRNEV
ncbi:MAG: hypothetical protein KDA45_06270, partial [Planctomycetales bacterium]|nr:hypothetical protein [Planctomycetales bacterium]